MPRFLQRLFARPTVELSHNETRPNALYAERYAAYQDACRRKDTRDQNTCWLALREAMTARLKDAA